MNLNQYERWTLKGMLDLKYELRVPEEFWDFLGGTGTYNDLLICSESRYDYDQKLTIIFQNSIDNKMKRKI